MGLELELQDERKKKELRYNKIQGRRNFKAQGVCSLNLLPGSSGLVVFVSETDAAARL